MLPEEIISDRESVIDLGINQTREDLHSMRLVRTREVRIEGDELLSMPWF